MLQVQHHHLQLVIEVVGDGFGHPTQTLGLLHLLALNLQLLLPHFHLMLHGDRAHTPITLPGSPSTRFPTAGIPYQAMNLAFRVRGPSVEPLLIFLDSNLIQKA
jgi:hypothetical protein